MRICGGYSIKGLMLSERARVCNCSFSLFIHEIPLRKKSRLPRSERCVASSTTSEEEPTTIILPPFEESYSVSMTAMMGTGPARSSSGVYSIGPS